MLPPNAGSETYPEATMESIYHLALGAEWYEAIESGAYSRSTLGNRLQARASSIVPSQARWGRSPMSSTEAAVT
jgi:hypothetical protein